ncbi:Polyprotein, related [Eimeria brunetti]|uniref:Polyprotein, related n=1 Tax=Eimeria brunetti TaxID=51314 RepID=U6LYH1_9EIME|nr:Polyprotein, related [Eimeria brunetti]
MTARRSYMIFKAAVIPSGSTAPTCTSVYTEYGAFVYPACLNFSPMFFIVTMVTSPRATWPKEDFPVPQQALLLSGYAYVYYRLCRLLCPVQGVQGPLPEIRGPIPTPSCPLSSLESCEPRLYHGPPAYSARPRQHPRHCRFSQQNGPFIPTRKTASAADTVELLADQPQWQQKVYADARRRDVKYAPVDLVWISIRDLPGLNQCSKFEPRFGGPFLILKRIGQVAYRVALPPTYTCHNVFHVSQLIPDRPRDPQMTSKAAAVGWLPHTDPEGRPTDVYEVNYTLAQRGTHLTAQYLVKWRRVPEDRETWEPADHLTACPVLLRAWRCHLGKVQRARRAAPAAAPFALSSEPQSRRRCILRRGGKWSGHHLAAGPLAATHHLRRITGERALLLTEEHKPAHHTQQEHLPVSRRSNVGLPNLGNLDD